MHDMGSQMTPLDLAFNDLRPGQTEGHVDFEGLYLVKGRSYMAYVTVAELWEILYWEFLIAPLDLTLGYSSI